MLSAIAAQHVSFPRNAGKIDNATHLGVGGVPGEGPYVRLWLTIQDGIIKKVGYECNGCPSSIAASSMVAQLATGRSMQQLSLLEPSDLLLILGGLPEGKEHYAELAVQALKNVTPLEHLS